MKTVITLQSLNESSDPGRVKKNPLGITAIPVEVFVIFVINNKTEFTVNDLMVKFDTMHKIRLQPMRMRQICNELASAGKIKKQEKQNRFNQMCFYYSFLKLL